MPTEGGGGVGFKLKFLSIIFELNLKQFISGTRGIHSEIFLKYDLIKKYVKNLKGPVQDQFCISWLRDSLCEIHERPHRHFSSCYDFHLERRVFF